jgi:hypothetical protein
VPAGRAAPVRVGAYLHKRRSLPVVHPASRLEQAQQAVASVAADWQRQGGAPQDVMVWLDGDAEVCIWVNGGGTIPSAWGDAHELVVSVADYLQAELCEAGARPHAWPVCPEHGVGLHAALEGEAVWWCRPGGHAIAAIGSLPER